MNEPFDALSLRERRRDARLDTVLAAFEGDNIPWTTLSSTPTTLAGYGISDAQALLVSGTNIKTINGTSILGSGDLTVSGSGGGASAAMAWVI